MYRRINLHIYVQITVSCPVKNHYVCIHYVKYLVLSCLVCWRRVNKSGTSSYHWCLDVLYEVFKCSVSIFYCWCLVKVKDMMEVFLVFQEKILTFSFFRSWRRSWRPPGTWMRVISSDSLMAFTSLSTTSLSIGRWLEKLLSLEIHLTALIQEQKLHMETLVGWIDFPTKHFFKSFYQDLQIKRFRKKLEEDATISNWVMFGEYRGRMMLRRFGKAQVLRWMINIILVYHR